MTAVQLELRNAPIVEAVLDIDCDLPPEQQLASLEEPARDAYRGQYSKLRKQALQEHRTEVGPDRPARMSEGRHGVQAFQFLRDDGKQLVQVRQQGFSFNRLAPYSSLDDYMTDIEEAWQAFVKVASPVQVVAIRLRYINRILIPLVSGEVDLKEYLKTPQTPKVAGLKLVGFLNQHLAVETDTGNHVNVVLATQAPENGFLPLIFDNTAASLERGDPQDWPWIREKIQSLRVLKNRVFRETLTKSCLNLFQQP